MDKKNLKELKVLLEEKRISTIKKLESVGGQAKGSEVNFNADYPDYGDSMEDNALEVADYTKNLSLEKELEEELHSVEKAIKRVDAGKYGKCNYCGKEIEIERLKIRPESTACVSCKKALKNEK